MLVNIIKQKFCIHFSTADSVQISAADTLQSLRSDYRKADAMQLLQNADLKTTLKRQTTTTTEKHWKKKEGKGLNQF